MYRFTSIFFALALALIKYAAIPVGNEIERSFTLENFQMLHTCPVSLCLL